MKRLVGWIGLCIVILAASVALARKAALVPVPHLEVKAYLIGELSATGDEIAASAGVFGQSFHAGELIKIDSEWMLVRFVEVLLYEAGYKYPPRPIQWELLIVQRGRFGSQVAVHEGSSAILGISGSQ